MAGRITFNFAWGGAGLFADYSRRCAEARRRRKSDPANSDPAGRNNWSPVFRPLVHWPPCATLVFARQCWPLALPALCALECRLAPRADHLSIFCGIAFYQENSSGYVGVRFGSLCAVLRFLRA